VLILLTGCASQPKLVNENTAAVQFARLSGPEKQVAQNFYDLGAGDAVKRFYWAQRAAQQTNRVVETPGVTLQRKYVELPSPAYQSADGTLHEASTHAVEVVQWISAVTKSGRKIRLCY
jgi:hypothetical protein